MYRFQCLKEDTDPSDHQPGWHRLEQRAHIKCIRENSLKAHPAVTTQAFCFFFLCRGPSESDDEEELPLVPLSLSLSLPLDELLPLLVPLPLSLPLLLVPLSLPLLLLLPESESLLLLSSDEEELEDEAAARFLRFFLSCSSSAACFACFLASGLNSAGRSVDARKPCRSCIHRSGQATESTPE